MNIEEKSTPMLMEEKLASLYVGESRGFLRRRRTNGKTKRGTPGPLVTQVAGSDVVIYRTVDLEAWLRHYRNSAHAAEKQWREVRSAWKTTEFSRKSFSQLLLRLESWMGTHRPAYLKELNHPVSHQQLDQFEETTGLKLPEDYRLLMSWRDGHKNYVKFFDPFLKHVFLPIAVTQSIIEELNGLVENGTLSERVWRPDWLPFMMGRDGNLICLDLSAESYGASSNGISR